MSKILTALSSLALLVGILSPLSASAASATSRQGALETQFQAAAREYRVPVELLMAIGYVNTHWEMPSAPSLDHGWGIMHLVDNSRQDTLHEAARLTGVSPSQLESSRAQNIRGGAALLASAQGPNRPTDLEDWYDAVVKLGGQLFAYQVYQTLEYGASRTLPSGETVSLEPQTGVAPRQMVASGYSASSTSTQRAEYPRAVWVPANPANYTVANRPESNPINLIIIHVTQGSYSSAINWFQNPDAQASAHYVIRSSDGAMTQMVRHEDIAWHAGNWEYNQRAIGIEHEGYIDDPSWFTDAMYQASARLTAWLCLLYRITSDRKHIIGHNEVPDPNNPGEYGGVHHHQDPGPYWNWTKYMSLVHKYTWAQYVDNRSSGFSASTNWGTSSWDDQKYGPDYRYARPKPVSDMAKYRFWFPWSGNYAFYAWWPSDPGYNSRTPIRVYSYDGVKHVTVNQTKNGGHWVYLGTFYMKWGQYTGLEFSRWTGAKGYVIADGVKMVPKSPARNP